ncbi:RNA polymerase-binding protein DksA [Campylobacter sp. MIT 97-5078]|uniref:RNA polymerase-binding protein DksA n=1 Tax=Campylobacter sp. MIT 97-5078 TaxID=1548153 RepID=UPI0005134434|nr:RNA polymerase-binding protein DksA [Campylobacter sp. MIT 97-5078]KGI56586.1 molecular chaperone DnaK [Campylobacter sp. MIT 97-5078]TQR26779.1 RNA polymerase-binding protein DksA [Campylobacter sp. MIT 97-5078]
MEKSKLKSFQKILEERKKLILNQLDSNAQEIEDLYNSEPNDNIDFSSINTSSQIEQTINSNLKQELDEIENSLSRIKQGIYGICESCEEDIDTNRLKIKPHAKYCINCRQSIEKGEKL